MKADQLSLEQASAVLKSLPKTDREWVLSLPANEATATIRLLVAFPGARFTDDPSDTPIKAT